MARKYERITNQIVENTRESGRALEWQFYDEVRFRGCRFVDFTWRHSKFHHVSFSMQTTFSRCRFEACRFWGQHTYLGGPSVFEDCDFVECRFENVQFWEADFRRCRFTGSFQNLVFYGPESPQGWATKLDDVDFSAVEMKLVDFRAGIDLSTTLLPPPGDSESFVIS